VETSLPASTHHDYYRLRTEWLRYKSQLYDGLTGLPALPAVMEDVRRIVESEGAADVVYVDLGRSGGQETKLGWAAYDGAVREFAAVLASLQASGELAAQDVVRASRERPRPASSARCSSPPATRGSTTIPSCAASAPSSRRWRKRC
jgi:hypothetical protein